MAINVNNLTLDTIYVERDKEGQIILYGAHWEGKKDLTCIVVRSSKDIANLTQKILGQDYTEDRVKKHFMVNNVHNFVGWLGKPLAFRVVPEKVAFVG